MTDTPKKRNDLAKPHVIVPAVAVKKAAPETVFCRRVERHLPVQEHLDCPYCYGKRSKVESAEHGRFCDFEKGKDPIHFGFPEDFGRHTQ